MNIEVLDCTLRDGGYCNNWQFGKKNIEKIICGLIGAKVDYIECGFLTDKTTHMPDISKFNFIREIDGYLTGENISNNLVLMLNFGEFDVANLPQYTENSKISGLRLAFHKKDCEMALRSAKTIKDKGYKVFLQPMVAMSYTDAEFLEIIKKANEINPYAFYIVDSFGVMKERDLMRFYYLADGNLLPEIMLGFHSHNNLQLSFANAQSLLSTHTERSIIIDSSIYGMGRGAGNLNTELIVEYLNENYGLGYRLSPLLEIIDEVLSKIHEKNYWGYSLPNYLSAKHNLHPNYASYLDDKKTLTYQDIDRLFNLMDGNKKNEFDLQYIEDLYYKYQMTWNKNRATKREFKNVICDKEILLIAPGKSVEYEKDLIKEFCRKNNVITMSINFNYGHVETDYIFLSNLRRYRELNKKYRRKCIITSNIPYRNEYLQVDYSLLLNDYEYVKDNAGLMAIKFCIDNGATEILLAGFDGYDYDSTQNYINDEMIDYVRNDVLNERNLGMSEVIKNYSRQIKIEFLTKPKHIKINNF